MPSCYSISYFIPPIWFFVFKADTFAHYAEISTIVVGTFIALTSYSAFLLDKSKIVELMDVLNSMSHRSEFILFKFIVICGLKTKFVSKLIFFVTITYLRTCKPFNL